MNKTIEQAFNTHVNAEFYSAYLYLSMANYFAAQNLEGMAAWMRIQVDEERMHGLKFVQFINDRTGRVVLEQIDKPKTDWSSPLEAFQDALEHERLISKKINTLVDLAIKESDHAANTFLQWFVTEQVEEEANVQAIVAKLALIKDDSMGLLMIDEQLGQRTASAGAAGAETTP
jgi:ferritin